MTITSEPVIPGVNLNGTDGKELLKGYTVALDKLADLTTHLRSIMPHGRDFQTKAPEALADARANHWKMLEELESIENHLTKVAIGISDQVNK